MPHYSQTDQFKKDWADLDPSDRQRFKETVRDKFVPDLATGRFRAGLRVKRVQGTDEVFELTWAPDGRATWQYGVPVDPEEVHVVWRRIGTHDVFRSP